MNSHVRGDDLASSDPAAIEADVRRQRAELAHTVDALTAKLDVKAHAEATATDVLDAVTTDRGRPRPVLVVAAAAGVVGLTLLLWRRRRG